MTRALRLAALFAALSGCAPGHAPASDGAPPPGPMTLPVVLDPLPEGPGRDAFAGACLVCHSSLYVRTQPRFPRKTWLAEVDKMIHAYGAPIGPDQVPLVVDYLVATGGRD